MAFSARSAVLAPLLCLSFLSPIILAQIPTARFDLSGPKIDVRVMRESKSLPIATVPNLQEGDQLWLHADLPTTQSVHYLLVAVFLRGTTNPPPEGWVYRIQTWDKKMQAEGVQITVPAGAQQALLLLAPETGGDMSTLRSAVRGRPGVFVRASQDLAEAGFEQARIEKYLDQMRQVSPTDPKAIAEHSDLLARTLSLKPNSDCFKRPVDQQYGCLTQTGTESLLEDGHGQSIVSSITSGASSDLINSATATQMAGGGMYSAYVGSIVDVVRIMSNLHTAHYQYIPAIAFPQAESLNLRLNTPPSFENPKSVIVIGLPAVQKAPVPTLRASNAKFVTCLLKPDVTLPVEGAPLVFSTSFAHDLLLHLENAPSASDLPLTPDAFQGGLVLHPATDRHPLQLPSDPAPKKEDTSPADVAKLPASTANGISSQTLASPDRMATVKGLWGFDHFDGPTLPVQDQPGSDWKLSAADDRIILGEQNHLLLSSDGTACIRSITAQESGQPEQKLEWKAGEKRNTVALTLALHSSNPGAVRLIVQQYGKSEPEMLSIQAFSKPAELKSIDYHMGDPSLSLSGSNLTEIRQLQFDALTFMQPIGMPPLGADRSAAVMGAIKEGTAPPLLLKLTSGNASSKLKPGTQITAQVTLADGRILSMPFIVQPPRPSVTILSRRAVRTNEASPFQLLNTDDVALDSQLTLSLRSATLFPRDGVIEIASEDGSLHDKLTLPDGSLVLQDHNTVLAQIDLRKTFGSSAFGPIRLRLVLQDGTVGDWTPLATLVRLPTLTDLACTGSGELSCALTGSNLYLLSAVAQDAAFTKSIDVPDGFVGSTLMVPKPAGGSLFFKLRDDPGSVTTAAVPTHP